MSEKQNQELSTNKKLSPGNLNLSLRLSFYLHLTTQKYFVLFSFQSK